MRIQFGTERSCVRAGRAALGSPSKRRARAGDQAARAWFRGRLRVPSRSPGGECGRGCAKPYQRRRIRWIARRRSLPWRFGDGTGGHDTATAGASLVQIGHTCVSLVSACDRVLNLVYASRARGRVNSLNGQRTPNDRCSSPLAADAHVPPALQPCRLRRTSLLWRCSPQDQSPVQARLPSSGRCWGQVLRTGPAHRRRA